MADLVTRSRLDDSDFNRGLARMRKEARDFNRRLGSEFSKVFSGAAVGGGIAAALYGIGNAVRGAFADADKVSDLAETLREMPSDLVRVGGAASLMGADMEAVIKAAVKLRVNLAKAGEGGREQAEMLEAMGLKASELSRMRLPDMIVALAGGYQKAESSGRGFLALQTLLSRSGTELVNLLQRSPEELRELFESIKPASDAALMGSDMEGVIKAAVKLRVNLGKASEGGKEQADTLESIGLKASELSRMRLPDMIVALAQGYQKAEASGRGFLALQTLLS
ncbi:MAG: hypothetical protein IT577_20695, partial [Verrucomicrobiae bacterium]|nr:hypothetical protein [Verrucomicrobiae bacterium]